MFNPVFTDPTNALLTDRLGQIAVALRGLHFSTREEYQAAVASAVNGALALGARMRPLLPIIPEGPAIVGDLSGNLTQLSQDLADTSNELARIEGIVSGLYNQAASSQNQLRQVIREQVYRSSQRNYRESFVSATQILSSTGTIDFNAAVATTPVSKESPVFYQVLLGASSSGSLLGDLSTVVDGHPDQGVVYQGKQLELIFQSPQAQILNRIRFYLDTYQSLEITSLTSSPDGTLVENLLDSFGATSILMDGLSGKYSGDVILDFPARMAQSVRVVIQDRTGGNTIALRQASFWARTYGATAVITSQPVVQAPGVATFRASQVLAPPYTSITHQISYDGSQFQAIAPGPITLLQSPFWYRAVLERNHTPFVDAALTTTSLDPAQSSGYTLRSSSAIPIGAGILERVLVFSSIAAPITLRDLPLPGTLVVQQGAILLSSGQDYFYSSARLAVSFPQTVTGVTLSYQTSAGGQSAMPALENYYTPLLYEVNIGQS